MPPDELVTPSALAVRHCREHGHRGVALIMNEEVKEDFAELDQDGERADAVIMGDLGPAFGYDVLNRAFRLVMDGAELIALQKNRYWLTADGLSLDVGPFVAAIEYAASTEAFVVGKPAPAFFELVLAGLGVEAGEAAMVGDDVETDVGGALRQGARRCVGENREVSSRGRARRRHRAHGHARFDSRSARRPRLALTTDLPSSTIAKGAIAKPSTLASSGPSRETVPNGSWSGGRYTTSATIAAEAPTLAASHGLRPSLQAARTGERTANTKPSSPSAIVAKAMV